MTTHPNSPHQPWLFDTLPGIDPGPLPIPIPGLGPDPDPDPDISPDPDPDPDPLPPPGPDSPSTDPGFPASLFPTPALVT